jgi:lysophospholipase L1-like esterase
MKERKLSSGKKLVFTLIAIVGLLVVIELLGTLYYYTFFNKTKKELLEISINLKNVNRNIVSKFKPHPYFNYVCNPEYQLANGKYPHNSRGFRKPEWSPPKKDVIRIITLGGSTTYGINSPDGKDVWPAILEKNLRKTWGKKIEVINLGVNNYTAFEVLGVTAMIVPELKPDIVIFHLGANDAFTACYPEEGGSDNTRFRFSWNFKPIKGLVRFIMQKSRIARILGYAYLASQGYLAGDMTRAMQFPFPSGLETIKNVRNITGKYFRNNLSNLLALVKNMQAAPVLLTHPLNPKWDYPQSAIYKVVIKAQSMNNDIIRELAEKNNLVLVPLYLEMRDASSFVDAVHNNLKGMKEKANLIQEKLNPLIRDLKKTGI